MLAVQNWVQQRLLTVGKVASDENFSDILMKPMPVRKHDDLDDELVFRGLPFDAA